jgi:hypothetical protein
LEADNAERTKSRTNRAEKPEKEYSLRIAIHGLLEDKKVIGDAFSKAELFLQHPFESEVLAGAAYDNPHYLLRPGASMPKPLCDEVIKQI